MFFRSDKEEGYDDIDKRNLESLKESDKYFFNICYEESRFGELLDYYLDNDFKLEEYKIKKTDIFFDYSKDLDAYSDYLQNLFNKL